MRIEGKQYQTIWTKAGDKRVVEVIDQRKLPFSFEIFDIKTSGDACFAIKEMVVRGAPLIGVTAAYGMYLSLFELDGEPVFTDFINRKADELKATRPTAVNLAFAVDEIKSFILEEKFSW